jgi:hypothetical protein
MSISEGRRSRLRRIAMTSFSKTARFRDIPEIRPPGWTYDPGTSTL